jgi:hypothetical protein
MNEINSHKPMAYPSKYKKVDGYECPKDFMTTYDLTNMDCVHCGRPKHYKSCAILDGQQACYGWGSMIPGPLSCKGYVKIMEESKTKYSGCITCEKQTDESYMVVHADGAILECLDCNDPNWKDDIPTIESRGAI